MTQGKENTCTTRRRISISLSQAEFRQLSTLAKRESMKPTSFVRNLTKATLLRQVHLPANIEAELKTLRFAIRNIANNVNQIAHHSNTVHMMTVADENNLLQHLQQLEQAVQSYTEGQIMGEGDDN